MQYSLLYKHQWKRRDLLCHNNEGDLFTCEDMKLKAHLVFHWCLYNKKCLQHYLVTSWAFFFIILSMTKFSIVIGSPRAYLSLRKQFMSSLL